MVIGHSISGDGPGAVASIRPITALLTVLTVLLSISLVLVAGAGDGSALRAASVGFVSMSPTRVLDTRVTSGGSGPVEPGSPVTVELSGVPADAAAAGVNVTATNATAEGFFTVWDRDDPPPGTSNSTIRVF